MAIRSVAQLKAWFKRGKYPTESQFGDWIDSFFHKEEDRIPMGAVENLPEQLNGKYPASDGKELERKHEQLSKDFTEHQADSDIEFKNIHGNLEELEAEDVKIWADNVELHKTDEALQTSLTNAHNNIGVICDMMKGGVTLTDARAALVALGSNYKDLYAVSSTLKEFLEANDTADTTINTWTEIESFLQGITDTESLTALLNALETKITENYSAVITNTIEQIGTAMNTELGNKLNKTDIINDLVSGGTDKVLSAEQGSVLSRKIAEIDKSMGGKMVSINQNVLNLLETSTSNEIFNAFGSQEAFIEIVTKTRDGAPLAANVMGLLMPLMIFGGKVNEEQGKYVLSFIYLSPMDAYGGEMFSFEMIDGIISLSRSKTNIGYADLANILTKSNLVSDSSVGGTDKPASAEAVKTVNDKVTTIKEKTDLITKHDNGVGVNRMMVGSNNSGGSPSINLAIGNSNSGFNSTEDGKVELWANNVKIGYFDSTGIHLTVAIHAAGGFFKDNN